MHPSDTQIDETSDWRDWLAFFGYAFGTAVLISVLLVSIVLVLSTPAGGDDPGANVRSALVPSATAGSINGTALLPLASGTNPDALQPSAR